MRINEYDSISKTSFSSYVISGIYHIVLVGYDHILLIVGLYLVSTQFSSLVLQISIFTAAHSITLALAALDLIRVPSSIVEPIIAASIIYVGIQNFMEIRESRFRALIIFSFGLLLGLGFTNVLLSLEVLKKGVLFPLLEFNIGVEIGQLFILILCFSLFGFWSQEKIWCRQRIVRPLSGLIILLGLFWLIIRLI